MNFTFSTIFSALYDGACFQIPAIERWSGFIWCEQKKKKQHQKNSKQKYGKSTPRVYIAYVEPLQTYASIYVPVCAPRRWVLLKMSYHVRYLTT